MPSLFKNKWFWIAVLVIFIGYIIFDLIFLNIWAIKQISTGVWDYRLVLMGAVILILDITLRQIKIFHQSELKQLPGILTLLTLIWAFILHGFFKALIFLSVLFILNRLLRIIVWALRKIANKIRYRNTLKPL